MNKKRLNAILFIILSLCVIFACDSGDNDDDQSDTTPPQTPATRFSFSADNQGELEVLLSWSLSTADTSIMGFRIYRQKLGEPNKKLLNQNEDIEADATTWSDTDVQNKTGYTYSLVSLIQDTSGNLVADEKEDASVFVAQNIHQVSNLKAGWTTNNTLQLTWDEIPDLAYEIFRGETISTLESIAQTDTANYLDQEAQTFKTYYYQVVTIEEFIDPFTNKMIQRKGPLSQMARAQQLTFVEPPVTIPDAVNTGDNALTFYCEESETYAVSGELTFTHQRSIIGTAKLFDVEIPVVVEGKMFHVELPQPGEWNIALTDSTRRILAKFFLIVVVDKDPPVLTLAPLLKGHIDDSFVKITGTAMDNQSGVAQIYGITDQSSEQKNMGILNPDGTFAVNLPLFSGENYIRIWAQDRAKNKTSASVLIAQNDSSLPQIVILSPEHGSFVTTDTVTVSGKVFSGLPANQIKMALNDQTQYPTGADGEYTFRFSDVALTQGANTIKVDAQTVNGSVSASIDVNYKIASSTENSFSEGTQDPLNENSQGLTIELISPTDRAYYQKPEIKVKGRVTSQYPIKEILINGEQVSRKKTSTKTNFSTTLFIPEDVNHLDITIMAEDVSGQTATLDVRVYLDNEAPQITCNHLSTAPAINQVYDSPYTLKGEITEKNLGSVIVNGQSITVQPGAHDQTWNFQANIDLSAKTEQAVLISVRDLAGNETTEQVILYLASDISIQIISPENNHEFITTETLLQLLIEINITGLNDNDRVKVFIDQAEVVSIVRQGHVLKGTYNLLADNSAHTIKVEVFNQFNQLLAEKSGTFTIIKQEDLRLKVERQEPENESQNNEPNTYIAFHFNKPIDPEKLSIEVLETVHGFTYDQAAATTNEINLIEVHHDLQKRAGRLSHFENQTTAVFYPEQEFAYSGQIFVTLLYEGEALFRSTFKIRHLPTLIEGFILDQFAQPVPNLSVEIPSLGISTLTDAEGRFSFGYGEAIHGNISQGRYLIQVNPDLKATRYGSLRFWANIAEGRLNTINGKQVPVLNTNEPFRRINSDDELAVLASGKLEIHLKDTLLIFPNGQKYGDVHVQSMTYDEIPYAFLASTTPHWMMAIHPMGIQVKGAIALTISIPELNGSIDYVGKNGDKVVILGLDSKSLQIVPKGIGEINIDSNSNSGFVKSIGPLEIETLDYLGYALVLPDAQTVLEQFANQEISLKQMVGILELQ